MDFCGALTIVFIVLKLTHVIAWSWWWVLAPFWAVPLIFLAAIVGGFFVFWFMRGTR